MSPDLQELEAKLSALRPAALDPGLLARLADTATSGPANLTPDAALLEATLGGLRPAPLPPALTAVLEWPAPAAPATVIPFPTTAPTANRPSYWNRPMLAAAAAVAILGASAALFMPRHDSPPATVAAKPPTPPRAAPAMAPAAPSSGFMPATFNTGLSQVRDEGVVWQGANQPRRVIKVIYRDTFTLVDADGREIEVVQPRVEYILLPEKID
jgi:hypothetical protein